MSPRARAGPSKPNRGTSASRFPVIPPPPSRAWQSFLIRRVPFERRNGHARHAPSDIEARASLTTPDTGSTGGRLCRLQLSRSYTPTRHLSFFYFKNRMSRHTLLSHKRPHRGSFPCTPHSAALRTDGRQGWRWLVEARWERRGQLDEHGRLVLHRCQQGATPPQHSCATSA